MSAATTASAAKGTVGPLAGMTVVELGEGTSAPFAAKLLGDYGAEVVKVERPGGDPSRQRGPFPGGKPDPEASGLFHYLNTNKLGVTLDPGTEAGRATLDRLAARADVFVTNLPAAALSEAGVAPAVLRARHPRLIIASISPFGTDGPWAERHGDELVTYAMGGLAYSTPGMPDASEDLLREPPLHPAAFVAETLAGMGAATGTMAAFLTRGRTNEGCHVEVSQQAAVAAMQQRDFTTTSYLGGTYNRLTNPTIFGRMPNFYLPCKDGYITLAAPMDHQWDRVVEAMGSPDWAKTPAFNTVGARGENWRDLRERLKAWTATLTGEQLFALAGKLRLPLFPFYPLRRLEASEHARVRASFIDVSINGHKARMPAGPLMMRASPWSLRRPAPRLGEHTRTVLADWLGEAP
ncbi:MAG: CoA transferase [Alphaproteobacteria bacterium]|nr:CoA transferase [Alphaproteobacteria bacterium]